MRKIQLKFALIKEDYSFEEIFKEKTEEEIKQKNNFKYFYDKRIYLIKNNFIKNIIDEIEQDILGARPYMIICYNIELNGKKRNLLIVCGDVRSIIDIWKLEDNFGLKIGINYQIESKQELKFRNISFKNIISGDHHRESKSISSNINNFSFNWLNNFLKELNIKTTIKEEVMTIKLNNYFQRPYNENSQVENIFEEIKDFIKKYQNLEHYKESFAFIDNLSLVKDKKFEEKIKKYILKIIEENSSNINFVLHWPEFEENNHSYYQVEKDNNQLFDLEIQEVIEIAKKQRKKIENITLYSLNDNNIKISSHQLIKCIIGEFDYEGKHYVLNEGKIIEIKQKFYDDTEREYLKFPRAKIEFPPWNSKIKEKDYNELVTEKKVDWISLDRKLLHFKNNQKLEIADILIINNKNKSLVAIKKWRNSASVSHLVQQIKNSIKLIFQNKETVEKYLEKKSGIIGNINLDEYKTFILAIATKKFDNNDPFLPKLPLFSKLSIIDLQDERYDKKIEISRIPLIN